MMFLASFCSTLAGNLTGFELTPQATVLFGLILGEISKAINNALSVPPYFHY